MAFYLLRSYPRFDSVTSTSPSRLACASKEVMSKTGIEGRAQKSTPRKSWCGRCSWFTQRHSGKTCPFHVEKRVTKDKRSDPINVLYPSHTLVSCPGLFCHNGVIHSELAPLTASHGQQQLLCHILCRTETPSNNIVIKSYQLELVSKINTRVTNQSLLHPGISIKLIEFMSCIMGNCQAVIHIEQNLCIVFKHSNPSSG